MRKEIFLAIIAGGAFGLLIAFGVWRVSTKNNSSSPTNKATNSPSSTTSNPSPAEQVAASGEFKIVIATPTGQSVFTTTPVAVTGATKQGSYIIVSGEDGDEIINSSDSGSFTSNVNMEGGANQIVLSAFQSDESETDANLLLVYSSQFTPDPSGPSISYIGTVTDITDSVIQIKDATGDIQQIKATDTAHFIDTRASLNKEIKSTDVAIGDYLVALGVKGANNILTSSRILVTDPLAKTTRRAFFGVVTDDSGINKFVMKNSKTGEVITITPAVGISVTGKETSLGKIVNNEKVIAVGEFKDGVMTARTIQVLK